jgi:hypothetical protein
VEDERDGRRARGRGRRGEREEAGELGRRAIEEGRARADAEALVDLRWGGVRGAER